MGVPLSTNGAMPKLQTRGEAASKIFTAKATPQANNPWDRLGMTQDQYNASNIWETFGVSKEDFEKTFLPKSLEKEVSMTHMGTHFIPDKDAKAQVGTIQSEYEKYSQQQRQQDAAQRLQQINLASSMQIPQTDVSAQLKAQDEQQKAKDAAALQAAQAPTAGQAGYSQKQTAAMGAGLAPSATIATARPPTVPTNITGDGLNKFRLPSIQGITFGGS